MRVNITLEHKESGERLYLTQKNKRNNPDRLELKKYSPKLRKNTLLLRKSSKGSVHVSRRVKAWFRAILEILNFTILQYKSTQWLPFWLPFLEIKKCLTFRIRTAPYT